MLTLHYWGISNHYLFPVIMEEANMEKGFDALAQAIEKVMA